MPETKVEVTINLPEPLPPGERLLYVVLHGLVSLVETDDRIYAVMIQMSGEHTYLAGSWLAERQVRRGSRGELIGVRPGGATLSAEHNPLLRIDRIPDVGDPDVHAVLSLPKPREIHYLDRGKIEITGGAMDRLADTPKTLSALRVFVYEIESEFSDVAVPGMALDWTANKKTTEFETGAELATLHIFDIPAGQVPPDHHVREFAVSSRMLGAEIEISEWVIQDNTTKVALPAGLPEFETYDFSEREREISDVFTDWLRTGDWDPKQSTGGDCKPCCGGSDGRKVGS